MVLELLKEAKSLGIQIGVSDGELKVKAAKGALTDELRNRIRASKEELTRFLLQLQAVERSGEATGIERIPRAGGALPLSFAQQRLWFIDQLDGGSAQYNIPAGLRLTGTLDRDALRATLHRLVARHESLRTRFAVADGEAVQAIGPEDAGFALIERDLRALAPAERETAVTNYSAEEAQAPFDLANGPLIRGQLLRLREDEHILLVTQHHIVSDGWSIGIMVGEVSTLYSAFSQGLPDPLPPLQIQYADYAAWQRRALQGDALARHQAFWRDQLQGAPRLLELPADYPRPAIQSSRGGVQPLVLSPRLTASLRALAQRHDATPFMVLMAGWSVLLSRLSRQPDVVVGTPFANRQRAELEPLIGFLLNNLAIRVRLDANPTVGALLEQVKATSLAAFGHKDLPFEQVVELLQSERSLSYSPLFQVSFTWHNQRGGGALSLPGLSVGPLDAPVTTSHFDLSLHLRDDGETYGGSLVYATDLFEPETIARWAASFQHLLECMVADEGQRVAELPLLGSSEREQLLHSFNSTVEFPDTTLIHERFEREAQAHPEAVAIVHDGESLSYAALNARANRLAHYLLKQGVMPDDRVAICLDRGIDMVVGLLGILKAGSSYVPLDPAYPADRLAFVLEDSAPKVLITHGALLERLPVGSLPTLVLDAPAASAALDVQPACNPDARERGMHQHRLAYVIYTSGSTGRPKGVMVEHAQVMRLFAATADWFRFDRHDVWTVFHSFAFDFSVWELWGALLYGGRAVIVPFATSRSPDEFHALLCRERVTVLNQTPSAFRQLVAAQAESSEAHALRCVVFGGEALETAILRPWYKDARNGGAKLINMYGITETTVHVTYREMKPEDCERAGRSPIGRPIPDLRVYILDSHGQPAPIGVVGELFVGGAGVARGYLNRPDLNAERFLADPFCSEAGARMYKSGDLARRLPDGGIEYIGRNDFQVKIRGFRIELGEIEARLSECPGVREAVVIARRDPPGEHRLVAYVVPAEGHAPVPSELRARLAADLPEHMLPAAFVTLAALPLTTNGKLDTAALPAADFNEQSKAGYVPPSTETERVLCEIWGTLLKLEQVGVHDNFFAVGGDSILSIQAVSRANKAGIGITTKQLFANQTIAELARVAGGDSTVLRDDDVEEGGMPLLPIHLEFLANHGNNPHHFNQSILLVVPDDVASERYKVLLRALFERHGALRLRFTEHDGSWQAAYRPLTAGMIDEAFVVEALPDDADERGAFVSERCQHYQRSLDIGNGPLLRVVHFRGEQGSRLLLTLNHIVVDGVSWRVILSDLEQAYRQLADGQSAKLPRRTSSYKAWSEALRQHVESPVMQVEHDYWDAQDAELSRRFPHDFELSVAPVQNTTRRLDISLPERETMLLLKECGKAYRTRINELLLSAVYLGFRRWTGSEQLRVFMEGHGREDLFEHVDTSETVGWFTSMFPLTLRCADMQVSNVIKAVKEQCRSTPRNGIGYGISRYLSDVASPRHRIRRSPYQLVFNYLGQFDQTFNAESTFQVAPEFAGDNQNPELIRDNELGLNGMVAGGILRFSLDYSALQFRDETMAVLASYIEDGLRAVVDHCLAVGRGDYTPSDFPLARVDADMLDTLQRRYAIDDLYPATTMQQGMLFHSELDRSAYVTQIFLTFRGAMDVELLRQAWGLVSERYEIFRTAFVGEGENLHQLVVKSVELPWAQVDWRHLSSEQQETEFEAYRSADKARGFDVEQAPLQRISVFRNGNTQYRMLWTHHHMLLDGWSTPLVYRDVMEAYHSLLKGEPVHVSVVPRYSNYIGWLQSRDKSEAERYWRSHLADIRRSTPLVIDQLPGDEKRGHQAQSISLSRELSERLQAFAKRSRTTVNTLVQLAWGLLLHRYSGDTDVVFGATVSGRPAAVPGVEAMVGLFINAIPVKVSFEHFGVAQLLELLHESFQESNDFGYLALAEIQSYSAIARGLPLFDSLIAFENFPIDAAGDASSDLADRGLEVEGLGANEQTNYKLTLVASMQEILTIAFRYRGEDFSSASIESMASHLVSILEQLPSSASVETIDLLGEAGRRAQLRRTASSMPASILAALRTSGVADILDSDLILAVDHRSRPVPDGVVGEIAVVRNAQDLNEKAWSAATLIATGCRGRYLSDDTLQLLSPDDAADPAVADSAFPQRAGVDAHSAAVRPRTRTEADMLSIWQDILGVEIAGVEDNFFDLGGNSLKAMRVANQVAAHFGIEKSLKALFVNNTIQSLSVYVDAQKHVARDVIPTVDKQQALPLSFSQQPLWVIDQISGGSPQYNMPIALRLRGELDHQALRKSLEAIVERHAVLRTVFASTQAGPMQIVQPGSMLPLPLLDLSGRAADAQAEAVAREVGHEAATVFDLARDRMLRARLLVLAERDHVLLLTMHHIASDGWSIGILTRELVALYTAFREGRDATLPALEIQYADYAHWQRETLADALELQWQHWQRLLRGAPALHNLPLDRPRPAQQAFSGAVRTQVLDSGLLAGLEALGKRHDATLFMVMQSAFAVMLGRWSHEDDIVLGSPVAGRTHKQSENLIGIFVNTLVFRYALSPTKTFDELLSESRQQAVEAFANQDIPLEMLVDRLQPERSMSHTPLIQVLFTLQNQDPGELRLPGLEIEGAGQGGAVAKFDLDLEAIERGGELHLTWRYATSLFEAATIERIAAVFEALLRAILADSSRPIGELPHPDQSDGADAMLALTARGRNPAPLSMAQERLWAIDRMTWSSPHYNVTFAFEMRGECRAEAVQIALADVVRRHAVLRTNYIEESGEVCQVVREYLDVPFATVDLTPLTPEQQQAELERLVTAESAHAFDLQRDILLRSRLIRLADDVHVVLVNTHHIAADEGSKAVLMRDFGRCYAFRSGQAGASPAPLSVQYADYAEWQREHLTGARLHTCLRHFRNALHGVPQLHNLRTDRPRPPVFSFRGAALESHVEPRVFEGLQRIALGADATLPIVMQAAFAVLLHRYSGERDIVIGTAVPNRQQTELADLVGCFSNMLVFRHGVSPELSFQQLLQQVRERVLTGLSHQQLPFELLVEKLQPTRTLSHSPLFQVAMVYDDGPLETLTLAGVQLRLLQHQTGTVKYDLTLAIRETDAGMRVSWEYACDLFEPETIERMAANFNVLLSAIVEAAPVGVGTLELLTNEETQRNRYAQGRTLPTSAFRSLTALLEAPLATRPEQIAVIGRGERLSYGELHRRANRLAHWLGARGIGPGALVGLCIERSADMMVCLLGILKAGAAYLPLDPGYPVARLAHMVNDSGARLVLTQASLLPLLPSSGAEPVCVDTLAEALKRCADTTPNVRADAAQLAYVIYTSGSTGLPKGVAVEIRNVVNYLLSMRDEPGFTAADRMLAVTPISFDIHVLELFLPLMSGGTVVIAERETTTDGHRLLETIAAERITMMQGTPATWRLLLATEQWTGDGALRILSGGEALDRTLASQLLQRGGEVWNMYGPTETAVYSSIARLVPGTDTVTIGAPIANTQLYVLNEQHQVQPTGVIGEIYIGGSGVTRGYLGRDDLTMQRFVPDPFADDRSARMYRTGDFGYRRADGEFVYCERVDGQVKVRGFRIELEEIERQLRKNRQVDAAVVVAREDALGDKQLVAYLVMAEGQALVPADIRAQLAADLPDYMLPALFVAMESFPLTSNGKLDRNALPAPERNGSGDEAYVPPSGAHEEALARIWQELLGLERVGRSEKFFSIGGNSIKAVQTVVMAAKAGLKIKIGSIFKFQTIEGICADIETAVVAAEAAQAPADDACELSPYQRAQLDSPGQAPWHIRFEVDAAVTETRFRHAVRESMARCPVLRMRVVDAEGGYAMKPAKESARELLRTVAEVHDVSRVPADALAEGMQSVWKRQDDALSELVGPLFRATLFVGDASSTCSLKVHRALLEEEELKQVEQCFRDVCRGTI